MINTEPNKLAILHFIFYEITFPAAFHMMLCILLYLYCTVKSLIVFLPYSKNEIVFLQYGKNTIRDFTVNDSDIKSLSMPDENPKIYTHVEDGGRNE